MPMTGAGLKAAIKGQMDTIMGSAEDDTKRLEFCEALGNAIINYIKTNAAVATTVAVVSVSGVTTGPGVSGAGTGTGSGTLS